ncbi:MAG: class I SAM-dependent methyltransferase [Beijerinckiaceae bacterium]
MRRQRCDDGLMSVSGTEGYSEHAEALIQQYESVPFQVAHSDRLHLYPAHPSLVLDVGAGTGRDAAALAAMGHTVVAVEPTKELREFGSMRHASPAITWLDDHLPALPATVMLGQSFDLILLTAVVMHLDVNERKAAFAVLASLLAPKGQLVFSLRYGPVPEGRVMFDVPDSEIQALAHANGLAISYSAKPKDVFDREGVHWMVYSLTSKA